MEPLGEALRRIRPLAQVEVEDDSEAVTEPGPECPMCRGFGFVRRELPVGDRDFGRAIPCSCRAGEARLRLRRKGNLDLLANRSFETFVPLGREPLSARAREALASALAVCRAYAEAPVGWLVLTGPPGCGKTHLAAAIANAQTNNARDAFFFVIPDLLDHLRATFGPESDVSYDELFESVRTSELLVLDDLGVQSSSAWAQEKLFQLLNHRYNAELPTVITTNQHLTDLDERLRARLLDARVSRVVSVRDWGNPLIDELLGDWPRGLRKQTFETFRDELSDGFTRNQAISLRTAHNEALEFAGAPEGWLVLVGEVRCGKTHLAAAIKNEREKTGEPTLFMTVPDLLDYLRATYAPTSDVTYDRGFEAIRNAPVLILDDYGAHSSTPWAEEKLFQLLNFRFNDRLPTVITTNLPLDAPPPGQVQQLRIVSRLLDPSLSKVVRIDAPPFGNPALDPRQTRVETDRRGRRSKG